MTPPAKTDDSQSTIARNGANTNASCSCFLLNQVYESYDYIQYYDNDNNNNYDTPNVSGDDLLITDEEKNEYYANKSLYLTERKNRREMLREQFQNFKLNPNFKIKPRNAS